MDNFAAGAESDSGAITIYYELTALMKVIKFPLAKWASNSEELKAIWRAEGQEIELQTQVLGVNWNTETDCFSIDPEAITNKLPEGPTTKRQLLQATARFYNPLGLYSPVSVVGKLLFQDTWCRELTGMRFCLLTLEHGGMLGYPPYPHCHKCTSLDG
jgi:hypothetical protein